MATDDGRPMDGPEMDFLPRWYLSAQHAQHADSEHERKDEHLDSLTMLAWVLVYAATVIGIVGAGLAMWWLA